MIDLGSSVHQRANEPKRIAACGLCEAARRLDLTGSLSVSYWRPNSNRKHKVRQFATLSVDGRPQLVAKIRTDVEDHKVAAEGRILRDLASAGIGSAPHYLSGDDGFIMRYVPDNDLPNVFRQANADHRHTLVRAVVEEVAQFHSIAPRCGTPLTDRELNDILGPWRPQTAAEQQALATGPSGAMHGDLGPWNIRIDAGSTRPLSLIDWEDFRTAGAPILDLLNALLTLTLLVHPEYPTMSGRTLYRRTLVEPGELPALLREGLLAYSDILGIHPITCLALIPTYCRGMLQRFEAEGRPTSHLFYVPLLEHFSLSEVLWITE